MDQLQPAAAAAAEPPASAAANEPDEPDDLDSLHAGGFAYAKGLRNRPDLNYECLELLWFDAAAERWVCMYGDEQLRLEPVNLVPVPDTLSGDDEDS